MKRRNVMTALIACAFTLAMNAAVNQTVAAPPSQVTQPYMTAAIDHLNKAKAILGLTQPTAKLDKDAVEQIKQARASLEKAEANKGGFRGSAFKLIDKALKAETNAKAGPLLDQAIGEVKKGIDFANKAAEKAKPPVQKNMVAAMDALEVAKKQLMDQRVGTKPSKDVILQLNKAQASLQQAEANKAGHRKAAMDLITQASKADTADSALKLVTSAIDEIKLGIAAADKGQ
jgi:hypothetical protein